MAVFSARGFWSRVWSRRFLAAVLIGLAEAAASLGVLAAVSLPSAAQIFDDRFPFIEERRRRGGPSPGSHGGFFGFPGWFSPEAPRQTAPPPESNAKAPPPRKTDTTPVTTVVVMGDSMADWLAYGLEIAAADSPDIGIVRKHRTWSGLIRDPRNESRSEYPDWPQAAREILNSEKANFVVMMIGLNDRRSIRAPAPARGSAAQPNSRNPQARTGQKPGEAEAANEESSHSDNAPAAEESTAPGTYEFRSEKWTELYIKRIDETIAALKSKNVPVFWVGLPPIRGSKSAADISFLNDLYRSRAEKAGITYIDTWDGFVDENGRFVTQGPDFEGQIRRLRSGDGVHFTQAGARKLAHYVEREIQRDLVMQAAPVALPAPEEPATPQAPAARSGNAAMARPLAGPVVPLTAAPEADELLGGTRSSRGEAVADPLAARVLVHGDAVPTPAGRADDFAWPRRDVAPVGSDPVVATTTTPMTPMQSPEKQAAAAPAASQAQSAAASPSAPTPRRHTTSRSGQVAQQQARERRYYYERPQPPPFFFPFFGR
jgi:hypothetical protein